MRLFILVGNILLAVILLCYTFVADWNLKQKWGDVGPRKTDAQIHTNRFTEEQIAKIDAVYLSYHKDWLIMRGTALVLLASSILLLPALRRKN